MSVLETGLRSGAIALLLLLAITAWRDMRHEPAGRLTVLLDLCAVAYLIESAPTLAFVDPPWLIPIRLLSIATPAVFLQWATASFDDFYRPRWWRWLPFGVMLAIAAWAVLSNGSLAYRAARIAALALVAAGMWQTLAGREADLVESRRRTRLVWAIAAGVWIAALTILSATAGHAVRVTAGVVAAGGILLLALGAALLRLRATSGAAKRVVATSAARAQTPETAAIDDEERALLGRLQAVMERERIYREDGFSLARLAARLAIPEYRLRRLINQRLGQRNFVSFVNGYRLAETMAALADPSQQQVPILTIALDTGFQSIGPFNRAFKAHTGQTPSEFRRGQVARAGTRPVD
jgi:AraC-like DNA-binding protein